MRASVRHNGIRSALRLVAAGAVLALFVHPVAAQGLIPADFFAAPTDSTAPLAVEADNLVFDGAANTISATGDVVLRQGGYTLSGDNLVYDRNTKDARFVGNVTIQDPGGNTIAARDLVLTGGTKDAFVNALTVTTSDGAQITADSVDYDQAVQTILVNATYAPCGDCIDDEGRRIGWSVSAAKITYNRADGSVTLEQPSLALLGVPVAWLPYLWLPDTSDSALARAPRPRLFYSDATGLGAEVSVTAYSTRWTDIVLTPTLMSRQGLMLGGEWVQRFDQGSFQVKASGLYQLDRGAFAGTVGDSDWRGAVQTSGRFTPVADWAVGWSYTAFSDAAYLDDYQLTTANATVNQVYAEHVTDATFIDARLQQFNLLGNVTEAAQGQQGKALPSLRFEHVEQLAPGLGRIEISGRLLGVQRDKDAPGGLNGVPYTYGYAGGKQHGTLQAGWQNQYIGAGGFVATPYLGGRADFAYYDGTSDLLPGETTLWSATPIAALDVRYPLMASAGSSVHIIEPIGQIVYRGSDTTLVGITNDNAQSFVLDDTNLFSYNRFSGSDRQETGLRANIGGRYMADFDNGGYLELIAGQSLHLAGVNAFGVIDHAQTAVDAGLENDASYAVLGAYGSFLPGLSLGGKLQYDTSDPHVARAGLDASFATAGYSASLDYQYIAARPEAGITKDQHEAGLIVGVPLSDYWAATATGYWDIAANSWLEAGGGLTYDDGYLEIGGSVTRTGPTHRSPDDTRFFATFRLKAPAGFDAGYSGDPSAGIGF